MTHVIVLKSIRSVFTVTYMKRLERKEKRKEKKEGKSTRGLSETEMAFCSIFHRRWENSEGEMQCGEGREGGREGAGMAWVWGRSWP